MDAFLNTNPYKVAAKRDPETRRLIYYVASAEDVPTQIADSVGDAVQNLRSARDYLAYQLVAVGQGREGPFTYVYFPVFNSAAEYEAKKMGQVKGMRKNAVEVIDAICPYRGGADALWQLHQLNRIDKHRLLITVGSRFQSFDVGAHMRGQMRQGFPDLPEFPEFRLFLKPADRLCPLKAGDELFSDEPDAEVNQDMSFRLGVALCEPGDC